MKCSDCRKDKDETEFSFKSKATGERSSKCKKCQRKYAAQHYLDNKEKYNSSARLNMPKYRERNQRMIVEYLQEKKCVDCGENDIRVLDFDHVDPNNKRDSISRLTNSCSWNTILDEINKCEVRCANCHRKKTADQFGIYKARFLATMGR